MDEVVRRAQLLGWPASFKLLQPALGGLFSFLLGGLTSLAFAPYHLSFLQLPLLALFLYHIAYAARWQRAAWTGLAFGIGQYLGGGTFLIFALHDGGELGWTATLISWCCTGLYLASFHAVFAAAVYFISRGRSKKVASLAWPLQLAACWYLLEYARCTLLTGFTGFALGYAHTDDLLKNWATVGGVLLVGFCVMLSAAFCLQALLSAGRSRLMALSLAAVPFIAGAALAHIEWSRPTGHILSLALLQGNLTTAERFNPNSGQLAVETYGRLLDRTPVVDLILFPEDAFPFTIQDAHPDLEILQKLEGRLRDQQADALLGISRWTNAAKQSYLIGMLHLTPGLPRQRWAEAERQDKTHLIPFIEYQPAWLGRLNPDSMGAGSNHGQSGKVQPPFIIKGIAVAATLCYEITFGADLRRGAAQAGLLVNSANNSWLVEGRGVALVDEMTRMRALETGRTVVRIDNVGVSGIYRYDGTLQARLAPFTRDVLPAVVEERSGTTPYVSYGELPWLLAAGLLLAGGALVRLRC